MFALVKTLFHWRFLVFCLCQHFKHLYVLVHLIQLLKIVGVCCVKNDVTVVQIEEEPEEEPAEDDSEDKEDDSEDKEESVDEEDDEETVRTLDMLCSS